MSFPVLICDDSALARKLMARYLPPTLNAEVFFAKHGLDALALMQQCPYLFKRRNVRPVTQQAEFIYQNITLNPMRTPTGVVNSLFLSIQDTTAEALVVLKSQQP